MATYTAQVSGNAKQSSTWSPRSVPTNGDTEIIAGVTVTYNGGVIIIDNPIILGGPSPSELAIDGGVGQIGSYVPAELDSGTTVSAGAASSTSTLLCGGGLSVNAGSSITAAASGGKFLIDGRVKVAPFGAGDDLINRGLIAVSNGDTLTISLSSTEDFNGNAISSSVDPDVGLENGSLVSAIGGALVVDANVATDTATGQAPVFEVGGNGRIDFMGSVAAGQTVAFVPTMSASQMPGQADGSTVRIENAATFAGAIANYGSVGNVIDLANDTLTGVSYTDGVFSAQFGIGSTVAARTVAMSLTGATGVRLAGDGGSGTDVTSVYTNPGSTISNVSALRENAAVAPASSAAPTLSESVAVGGVTTTYLDSDQINFADGSDYYGAGTPGGEAELIFYGLLGRQADPAALGYYTTQLQNGAGAATVVQEIVNSPEYASVNPQDGGDIVSAIYQHLLGRAATNAEQQFWEANDATNGFASTVTGIANSTESLALQNAAGGSAGLAAGVFAANPVAVEVQDAYQTVLGRSADAAGLSYWTQQLEGGVTQADLLSSFIASAEFTADANARSVSGFVAQIQTNTQGGADAAGLAYWGNQVATGAATRTDVAAAYTNSATLAQRESGTITGHGIITKG